MQTSTIIMIVHLFIVTSPALKTMPAWHVVGAQYFFLFLFFGMNNKCHTTSSLRLGLPIKGQLPTKDRQEEDRCK